MVGKSAHALSLRASECDPFGQSWWLSRLKVCHQYGDLQHSQHDPSVNDDRHHCAQHPALHQLLLVVLCGMSDDNAEARPTMAWQSW